PAYGPQNDVTLKMPAFEWVHVQLHQQKGMISLSPPTICNSAPTICNSASTLATGLRVGDLGGSVLAFEVGAKERMALRATH
ncbi:hypothetical protein ACMZZG_23940, partial [Pseudocitrobacter faecalis]|uniref:hypothetical protein n=1 Tax=Pseudocitrobacter faecalis TaxID=1398493 RepID=UPI0039EFB40D